MSNEFEDEIKIKIENLFREDSQIDEVYDNANPIGSVYEILETHYRRETGNIHQDTNMLMTIAEFHVNNLIYLKEHFPNFPNRVHCKLLNLLNILLQLKEEKKDEESVGKDEPDFSLICKRKLQEIKKGLYEQDLVFNNSSGNTFYLKSNEVIALMEYIKTFYFPFIRLYYHFLNIEKITENKRIVVIINRPLHAPPLSSAVMQIQEKNLFEEQKSDTVEDTKPVMNEENEKKETSKQEEKIEDKPETYHDLMNKLTLNAETKKIITEKIEEMKKEVDYKITERQKKLDDKYKEIEDTIKGKKK